MRDMKALKLRVIINPVKYNNTVRGLIWKPVNINFVPNPRTHLFY